MPSFVLSVEDKEGRKTKRHDDPAGGGGGGGEGGRCSVHNCTRLFCTYTSPPSRWPISTSPHVHQQPLCVAGQSRARRAHTTPAAAHVRRLAFPRPAFSGYACGQYGGGKRRAVGLRLWKEPPKDSARLPVRQPFSRWPRRKTRPASLFWPDAGRNHASVTMEKVIIPS